MNGLRMAYDPRVTPARPDVAAQYLQGRVEAKRFVTGTEFEVRDAQAPVRRQPSPEAALDTEVLHGERVTIYDDNGEGWSWGQLASDGYVGWIPTNALVAPGPPPTHRVAAVRTLVFPVRSIKAPPVETLPLGARVAIGAPLNAGKNKEGADLTDLASGFCVPTGHIAPLDSAETDFVAVAERLLGVPYLWGGKTNLGLDCSGLVQIALAACGVTCPRDTDMQERALGAALPDADPASFRRGDLIFWKGHVAIVRDEETILHANAFHMAAAIEPTRQALRRIADAGTQLVSVKRLKA